ncbi:hypothetical protein G5T15_01930 [Streptococcus anginosus]|nr:hypothetical protein [Streptococcus anginosus]MCW0987711.1 hypothetical protein [Streptococcus anginosus]NGG22770.1 hypothetical protein [Streptococcus anginosus]WEB05355.1 hypothetical protein PUW62_04880 [Streptococcus anginosus]
MKKKEQDFTFDEKFTSIEQHYNGVAHSQEMLLTSGSIKKENYRKDSLVV